ncbi:MAG TPA: ABC transporter ATP-binding protein [Stellaceae bacterium]|nr:ABC transporter ATP-binding protein [Stellaceae bacterium]
MSAIEAATVYTPAADTAPVPALSVESVSHAFSSRQVLADVTFSVPPGGFTLLLGLNGAGKTTLFSLITRLYYSASGTISVYGHEIRREPLAALALIGVVFQQPTLDLDLSVEQNLFYHASLHGMSRHAARPRIEEELARAGLADRRRDKVRQLSGGLRRRVELVRALIHNPPLLLLDEPTVGLDVQSRRFLLEHVRGLCAERGTGVLWATHLVDEASPDCQIVLLRHGCVETAAPAAELVRQAGNRNLAAVLEGLLREGKP